MKMLKSSPVGITGPLVRVTCHWELIDGVGFHLGEFLFQLLDVLLKFVQLLLH